MLIYITDRKHCSGDFLWRIKCLAQGKPDGIMLREKDLSPQDYETLALKVHRICQEEQLPFIVNQNLDVAIEHKLPNIHLSMENLRKAREHVSLFDSVGASIHSVEEAKEAEQLGVKYVIAGHIYETNSKKGVPPRGVSFLKKVCDSVQIPVFAIGGIATHHLEEIYSAGAEGVCIMSLAMTDPTPEKLSRQFHD